MKISDTLTLAVAKIKIRKRRAIISSLTISLLFGVIIMILVVFGSFIRSFDELSSSLFDGQTYTAVAENIPSYNNQTTFARAKELYDSSISPDKQYPILIEDQLGNTVDPYLDRDNEFAKVAISEFQSQESKNAKGHVQNLVKEYGGDLVSEISELNIKKGIVGISSLDQSNSSAGNKLTVISDEVLGGLVIYQPQDDVIPVIVYTSYAEDILDLEPLPKNSSLEEKHDRLNFLYQHAPGTTFSGTATDELISYNIDYQIVGLVPNEDQISTNSGSNINLPSVLLASITNSSYYDMLIPSSFVNSEVLNYYQKADLSLLGTADFMVKFGDASDASSFIRENSCNYTENNCSDLYMSEFITSRVALYDIAELANAFITYIALFFGLIATFIMIGTLSRVIDDERQATAIYRAVGASKSNIRQIYFIYTLILSALSALFALVIGLAGSVLLHLFYADSLTLSAYSLYGIVESSNQVYLTGFDARILGVLVAIFIAGLISVLLSNDKITSKNIVKDIKD